MISAREKLSRKRRVPVTWSEHAWSPIIRHSRATGRLDRDGWHPGRSRTHSEPDVHRDGVAARSACPAKARRTAPPPDRRLSLALPNGCRWGNGFTLIEMLTVVAIIGILVALLLPALAGAKERAKVAKARTQMAGIELSIKQYETEYSRFPATPGIEGDGKPDYTFAGDHSWNPHANKAWNSVAMEILLDLNSGANAGHARNPRNLVLLHAKQQAGDEPGLSTTDHIFRDPWGTPYIITVDLDGNEKCLDAAYRDPRMHTGASGDGSVGYYGLTQIPVGQANAGQYELNRSVMIWSLGRDKQVDPTQPAISGVNKDNLLGWQ